jgi:hypothetical protein
MKDHEWVSLGWLIIGVSAVITLAGYVYIVGLFLGG